ncbi:MAG: hypothetical protein QOD83_1473 [Solirubrobacteraceae bacterium]|jgi:hypothetical protein|nr:hypothetical protein [Solirubrobacteraceae bacterium]
MNKRDDIEERRFDGRVITGAEDVMRAAERRKRAAQQRAHAAEQRDLADLDRHAARADRERSARERLRAFEDRGALAQDLADRGDRCEPDWLRSYAGLTQRAAALKHR